jgi:hypothetical protein
MLLNIYIGKRRVKTMRLVRSHIVAEEFERKYKKTFLDAAITTPLISGKIQASRCHQKNPELIKAMRRHFDHTLILLGLCNI